MQLRQVDRLVESLIERLPPGGLLAVVADHGMVAADPTASVDLDSAATLADGVEAIGGEPRARHVYTTAGATADVLDAWRETLGDRAWVVTREQAIDAGWFGPDVAERVRPRIGDVVAAARDSAVLVRRTVEPMESALVGHHGSMTDAEQLVPLLIAAR
jgi:Type I phosphodiesterase / nucleotide pyrophosphatase